MLTMKIPEQSTETGGILTSDFLHQPDRTLCYSTGKINNTDYLFIVTFHSERNMQ